MNTTEFRTALGLYTCEEVRLDELQTHDEIVTDSPLGTRVYRVTAGAASDPNGWVDVYELTSSGGRPEGFFSFPAHTLMNRVVR
jgi:hypothetical protein